MKKPILFLLSIFLFPGFSFGQAQIEWINTYPTTAALKDGAFDHEGNLILAGNSLDIFTMKIDLDGNTLWQTSYDSAYQYEEAAALSIDADDNIYITGHDSYYPRGFTLKYSKSGSLIWKVYNHGDWLDNFYDRHSNIYVVGRDTFIRIKKYDSAGAFLDVFGADSSLGESYYIQLNNAGEIFIGGTELISLHHYFFAEKYDSNGILQWHTTYFQDDTVPQFPRDMVLDKKSNLYMVASAKKGNEEMYFAIKYKPNGSIDWTVFNSFGNTIDDEGRAMAVDESGNVYVTGFTLCNYGCFCYTAKYDSIGNLMWVDTIAHPFPGPDQKISTDKNGNVYVLTPKLYIDTTGHYYYYYSLKKLSTDGDSIWQVDYPFSPSSSWVLLVDSSENVFVSCLDSTGDNLITIKYSQTVGINSISSKTSSLRVFPNPFHLTTSIQIPSFESPQKDLRLEVYDVPGKLIRTESVHQTGNITFDRRDFKDGMYILKITSADKIVGISKIVIQ